jgi:hypothetical protein
MKKKVGRPKKADKPKGNTIVTATEPEVEAVDPKDALIAELMDKIVALEKELSEVDVKVEKDEPRQWVYHADIKPEGKIVTVKEAKSLKKQGWVNTPADFK